MIHLQIESGKNFSETLINDKIPHVTALTTNSELIEVFGEKYMISPKCLSFPELGFINQVKTHCKKLHTFENYESQVRYNSFGRIRVGEWEDVTELDVNSAYWNLAYKYGILNKELYTKGLQQNKVCRLVALGALATTKEKFQFDGHQFESIDLNRNEQTRSMFFYVAYRLGEMMHELIQQIGHENFYLYWVDAIFIKKSLKDYVIDYFSNHNLELKEKVCEKIEVSKEGKTYKLTVWQNGKSKDFFKGSGNTERLKRIKSFQNSFKDYL